MALAALADLYCRSAALPIKNPWWEWGLWTVGKIDDRAQLLSVDKTLDSSYDPYSFLRNVYLQHRDFMVSGGATTDQQDEEEQRLYDEAQKDTDADAAPKSAAAEERARTAKPAAALNSACRGLHARAEQLLNLADPPQGHEPFGQGLQLQLAAGELGGGQPVEQHRKAGAVGGRDAGAVDLQRLRAGAQRLQPRSARGARGREGQRPRGPEAIVRQRREPELAAWRAAAARALTWSACRSLRASRPTPDA